MRSTFVQTPHIVPDQYYFKNLPYLFTVTKYGKRQTHFSSALGPETEEQIKLAKDKICFDL